MRRDTLRCGSLLVCVLALAGREAPAFDGKDKPALAGAWEKKDAGPKLEFTGDDKLTILPHGDKLDFRIDCSYTATKDGLVKAKVKGLDGRADVVEKAKESLPVGTEFRFKWKVEGDAAKLDAVEGKEIEHAKSLLEGGYSKKP